MLHEQDMNKRRSPSIRRNIHGVHPTTRRLTDNSDRCSRSITRCSYVEAEVCSHASAATSLQSNGRDQGGQHAWPFRLVRVDDDGHGGRQGLLRRCHGLGHAGRVDAWHGVHLFYCREGLGQRADWTCRRTRRMGCRPSWLGYVGVDDVDAAADRIWQPWRHRLRPAEGHHQHQPLFGRRRPANGKDRVAQMAESRPGATGGA